YQAIVEFQGATELLPEPGGLLPPTSAVDLTDWSSDITVLDGKRFIRWRWRFELLPGYPADTVQLPAILDFTVPFTRTGE
ncbi:MAG: hypothetical protein ACC662_11710, partial [Planctomycetota bacterium]